jgi:hypothetical protein
MKIPSFLYGRYPKVKLECRRKAKDLRRGVSFDELPADQWLDTGFVSGAIVVDGPSRVLSHQVEQFCCFALIIAVHEEWKSVSWAEERDTIVAAFHQAAMTQPWLFLGLLDQNSRSFLDQRADWVEPFARAAVKFWPVLEAEGARYTKGLAPTDLWSLHTSIKFALARLGMSVEKLRAPLPPGGLAALTREVLPDIES